MIYTNACYKYLHTCIRFYILGVNEECVPILAHVYNTTVYGVPKKST